MIDELHNVNFVLKLGCCSYTPVSYTHLALREKSRLVNSFLIGSDNRYNDVLFFLTATGAIVVLNFRCYPYYFDNFLILITNDANMHYALIIIPISRLLPSN